MYGVMKFDESKKQIGEIAWGEAREFLKRFGWELQQIDWLGKRDGIWVKFEIKAQEPFIPPPFKGHGLPRWQIKSSQNLLVDKEIRTYLIIKDLESKRWIGQFIDILEKAKFYDTYGDSPRRIYPIENFEMVGESFLT